MRALVVSSLSICFTMLLVVALLTAQSLAGVEQAQAQTIEAHQAAQTFTLRLHHTAANVALYQIIDHGASGIHAAAHQPLEIPSALLGPYQLTMQR
ncbi:hypothetical protein [Herpetosiphon geysericola]|uniref:Uncharacterized protein n=1 Tax=Herpetosiphon geysericola TaxID=70996 RepID=A0A0P6YBJ6_9CHLR|nr:hypothetical protein [Herpetosiphon geysericola]KPL90655.1 hypothetical protein SE18_06225 [Herpetosiphon geysericola]